MKLTLSASRILFKQEEFWKEVPQSDLLRLLQYSLFLGLFPFSGYLFAYTVRGTIWNVWPFVHTTLDVGSGLVFASLQWILFAVFPVLASLILERIASRLNLSFDFSRASVVATYALTPLSLGLLFAGVPYLDRVFSTFGFSAFPYMLYYGFRSFMQYSISASSAMASLYAALFILIRQLFVFAIGY